MKQTVYLNCRKAIIHEDAGCGSRPTAWIFDKNSDGTVTPTIPDYQGQSPLSDLINELQVTRTNMKLVLA